MGPVEALELAKKREMQSIELYEKFVQAYPVARDVFDFLLSEENRHLQLIEKKLLELKTK